MGTEWWIVTPSEKRAFYFGKSIRSVVGDVRELMEDGATREPEPHLAHPGRYADAVAWLDEWERPGTELVCDVNNGHDIIFGTPKENPAFPSPLPGWTVDDVEEGWEPERFRVGQLVRISKASLDAGKEYVGRVMTVRTARGKDGQVRCDDGDPKSDDLTTNGFRFALWIRPSCLTAVGS